MTSEQEVRDALRSLAEGEPAPADAWAQISAAIDVDDRRQRRRRWAMVGGTGAVLAAAASITALVVVDRGDEQVEVVPPATEAPSLAPVPTTIGTVTVPATTVGTPASTAPPTPAPTTTPPAPAASPIVVVSTDGVASLHDTAGQPGPELASEVGDVSIGADHLYYSDSNGVWRVGLDGADREQLVALEPSAVPDTPLAELAVTADGQRLAYTLGGEDTSRIYVLDVASGETREWATAEDEQDFFLVLGAKFNLAWAPDGQRLAFVNGYEGRELYVLDTASAATLSDATPLGEVNYASPSWIDDERLVAVGECCYPEPTEVRERVDVIDAVNGTALQQDLLGDAEVVVVERITGGMLFITADALLYRLDDGQTTPATVIAEGVTRVAD